MKPHRFWQDEHTNRDALTAGLCGPPRDNSCGTTVIVNYKSPRVEKSVLLSNGCGRVIYYRCFMLHEYWHNIYGYLKGVLKRKKGSYFTQRQYLFCLSVFLSNPLHLAEIWRYLNIAHVFFSTLYSHMNPETSTASVFTSVELLLTLVSDYNL